MNTSKVVNILLIVLLLISSGSFIYLTFFDTELAPISSKTISIPISSDDREPASGVHIPSLKQTAASASLVSNLASNQRVPKSSLDDPSFMISPLSGTPFDLYKIPSKVVLINFWATWCGPCQIEIPNLISLQNTYSIDDLQIIGVSLDDSRDVVYQFSDHINFNYPITMYHQSFISKFGSIRSIPTTFILDQNRNVVRSLVGYHSKHTIESIILSIL